MSKVKVNTAAMAIGLIGGPDVNAFRVLMSQIISGSVDPVAIMGNCGLLAKIDKYISIQALLSEKATEEDLKDWIKVLDKEFIVRKTSSNGVEAKFRKNHFQFSMQKNDGHVQVSTSIHTLAAVMIEDRHILHDVYKSLYETIMTMYNVLEGEEIIFSDASKNLTFRLLPFYNDYIDEFEVGVNPRTNNTMYLGVFKESFKKEAQNE